MYLTYAWAYANRAFSFVWSAFHELLVASDTMIYYLVIVLFAIAFRLLAVPLVGAALTAGSDMYKSGANRTRDSNSDSTEISRIN